MRPAPPAVNDAGWPRTPVDSFIRSRLDAAGLTPSPPADRRTLIRRATIDLWGTPPSAEEIDAFESDRVPTPSTDSSIDCWHRHGTANAGAVTGWTSPDTPTPKGTSSRRIGGYPYAYTYRDYVLAAWNADLPYNQFLIAQIAADQLPVGNNRQSLAAMGFLTVGRRFLLDKNEIIDDRIDVVTRGLMGLTVTCARCHDHKFDPVPTEDYYSLYGVFASSEEPGELPLLGPPANSTESADYERKRCRAAAERDQFLKRDATSS